MGTDLVPELPCAKTRSFDQRAEFVAELRFQAWRLARREADPQFEDGTTLLDPAHVETGIGHNLFKCDGQGFCRPPAHQSRTGQELLGGEGCGLSRYNWSDDPSSICCALRLSRLQDPNFDGHDTTHDLHRHKVGIGVQALRSEAAQYS
jgi:hypothetical protein